MLIGSSLYWIDGVELNGPERLVALLMAGWLLLGEPLLGRYSFRRFLRAMRNGDPQARLRLYRSWTALGWLLAAVMLTLVLFAFDWHPAQLGLRLPSMTPSTPVALVLALAIAVLVGAALGVRASRRKHRPAQSSPQEGAKKVVTLSMLPQTHAERRAFAALAVTAGITEEVVWRGVLLALLVAWFPSMPLAVHVLVLTVIFGFAHLYQGIGGVISTGMIGAVLTVLYLASGSLLLPIALHILIDLLALLRPAQASPPPSGMR